MNSCAIVRVGLLALLCAAGSQVVARAESQPQTEDEKTFYALGRAMGRNVAGWKLTPGEVASLERGLADAVTGAGEAVDLDAYGPKIQALAKARMAVLAEEAKTKSQAFLDEAAKAPGSVKTATGLVYRLIKAGTGASPTSTSKVKVSYEGRLPDGTVFDSSVKRGEPAQFGLTQVIPCWGQGLQLMKVGEKAQLVCPSVLAYGDEGRPPVIPGGSALVFEVELLEIQN